MNKIFKCIVGSQAYGTAIETSDIDYKGVYVQPKDEVLSFRYKEQMDFGKDETYYEIRRFLQLAATANSTILEMMFMPRESIITLHSAFSPVLQNRQKFLTKKCLNSFGGYAVAQIKKAKGLNKKMNWEATKVERKTVLDFCYIHEEGKSIPVERWLKASGKQQRYCGLVGLEKMPGCHALYYDHVQDHVDSFGKGDRLTQQSGHGYSGIIGEDSNDVRLSSVPKYTRPETVLSFNKEGYSMHCKDYNEYQVWLENRNTARYVDTVEHGQKIDGKNIMHCRRLLDMAMEIPSSKDIKVLRPNAEYLLSIRRGEVPLDDIIDQAEKDIFELNALYQDSDLPEEVDFDFLNDLLIEVRNKAE